MRKFAVPMLLLGGLLLSGTVFAAQEAQPAAPAAKHEMQHETKAMSKQAEHHSKSAWHHKTKHHKATKHHAKVAKHTAKKTVEKKPAPAAGGGM